MPDRTNSPQVSRDQQLRVFFSADLCGGDAFKHRWPAEDFARSQAWPAKFRKFFTTFEESFLDRIRALRGRSDSALLGQTPRLWKMEDDALVYVDMVQPDKTDRHIVLGSAV